MIEYPKIETVFDRDERSRKVIPGKLRLPEFALISRWLVTEKIDGTNIRVHLRRDGTVAYNGRTDNAQLHAALWDWLHTRLPAALVAAAFDQETEAVLFGEGYGPKIQKGGVYRKDVNFRLFDVAVQAPDRLWWLTFDNVLDVAGKLGVSVVPLIANAATLEEACAFVSLPSAVASEEGGSGCTHEGVVCRTDPLLFTRSGHRVMWKLKGRDLAQDRPAALKSGPQENP